MTTDEKENQIKLKMGLSVDFIREAIDCAKDNAKAFVANVEAEPDCLQKAIKELETLVGRLKANLRSAENADSRCHALGEALEVLNQ